jgi:hypothetical protein
MDGSESRSIPAVIAQKVCARNFAAMQGHGFENPFVPECRFLIGFPAGRTTVDFLLVSFVILLGHSPVIV